MNYSSLVQARSKLIQEQKDKQDNDTYTKSMNEIGVELI